MREFGCPVCNGMTELRMPCPVCGHTMNDDGMLENYYGPYSPYDNTDIYEPPVCWEPASEFPCVHLCTCPECGHDTRVGIRQVEM